MRFILSQSTIRKVAALVFLLYCLSSLTGCEAFVRKFTRKPKYIKKEEPIIQPESYPEITVTKEDYYKDSFLFWESWSDELISFLTSDANFKKQKQCANESLENLIKCQGLLNEAKAREFQPSILEFSEIKDEIFSGNLSSSRLPVLRDRVKRVKVKVRRNFSYTKVKDDLSAN